MQIDAEVIKVLAKTKSTGNVVKLDGQIDRKLYIKVDEVLQAAGFKWNKKAKAHVGEDGVNAEEVIDRIVAQETIEVASDIGFFETPALLAEQLVALAGVKRGSIVLEPSAGKGRIVDAILKAGGLVTACEYVEAMREKLVERGNVEVVGVDDFLDMEIEEEFDAVVMNPPFRKVGKGDHLDHVRHAFAMLKPGGQLVSVLPAGIDFREDRRHAEFRTWVETLDGVIDPLPAGSFRESGTGVNTVTVFLVKP